MSSKIPRYTSSKSQLSRSIKPKNKNNTKKKVKVDLKNDTKDEIKIDSNPKDFKEPEQVVEKPNEIQAHIAELVKSTLQMDKEDNPDNLDNELNKEFDIDLNTIINDEYNKASKQVPISLEQELENELLYHYEPSEDSLLYTQLNPKLESQKTLDDFKSLAVGFTLNSLELSSEFVSKKRGNLIFSLSLPLENGRKTVSLTKSAMLRSTIEINMEKRFQMESSTNLVTWSNDQLVITVDLPNEWCCKGLLSLVPFQTKQKYQKKVPLWTVKKYSKSDGLFIGDLQLTCHFINYDDTNEAESALNTSYLMDSHKSFDKSFAKSFDTSLNNLNPNESDLKSSHLSIKPDYKSDLHDQMPYKPKISVDSSNALSIFIESFHPLQEIKSCIFCCLKLLPLGQPIQTLVQSFPFQFKFEINLSFVPISPGIIELWEQGSPNILIGICKLSFDLHNKSAQLLFPSANFSVVNPLTGQYMGGLQLSFGYGDSNALNTKIETLNRASLQEIQENKLVDAFIDATHKQSHQYTHTSLPQLHQLSQLHNSYEFLNKIGKTEQLEHLTKQIATKADAHTSQSFKTNNVATSQKIKVNNSSTSRHVSVNNAATSHLNVTASDVNSTSSNILSSPDKSLKSNPNVKSHSMEPITESGQLLLNVFKIYPSHSFQDRHIEDFESQSSNKTITSSSAFYITFNWYSDGKSTSNRVKKTIHFKEDANDTILFNHTMELPLVINKHTLQHFKHRKQTLKLWRRNTRGDFLIAFTIIDLHYLFDGLDSLEQWFDLVDSNGLILGQILIRLEIDSTLLKAQRPAYVISQLEKQDSIDQLHGREITQHDLESIYSESNFDQMQKYLNRLNNK